MLETPPSVAVEPPLEPAEARFIAEFARYGEVRRVWPGQPSSRSPWCPSDDGCRLVLDVEFATAAPSTVASWLRFLDRSFLAPSTPAALAAALSNGLRTGHQVVGVVRVGRLEVSVDRHRVEERTLCPDVDAIVLDLAARLRAPAPRRSEPVRAQASESR